MAIKSLIENWISTWSLHLPNQKWENLRQAIKADADLIQSSDTITTKRKRENTHTFTSVSTDMGCPRNRSLMRQKMKNQLSVENKSTSNGISKCWQKSCAYIPKVLYPSKERKINYLMPWEWYLQVKQNMITNIRV